jgi:hypothetical protein
MRVSIPSFGQQGDGLQHVLMVGGNERTEHLVKRITGKGSPDCRIEGFLDDDPDRGTALEELGVPYLGPVAALERLMIDRVIDCVYVCLPLRSSYDRAKDVLDLCHAAGVPVFLLADFLPMRTESGDLWCMEPRHAANLLEPLQGESVSSPQVRREGPMARMFTVLTAAFSGLPAFSRQQGGGRPRPPYSI